MNGIIQKSFQHVECIDKVKGMNLENVNYQEWMALQNPY